MTDAVTRTRKVRTQRRRDAAEVKPQSKTTLPQRFKESTGYVRGAHVRAGGT